MVINLSLAKLCLFIKVSVLLLLLLLISSAVVHAHDSNKARQAWGSAEVSVKEKPVNVIPLAINLPKNQPYQAHRDYLKPLLNVLSQRSIYTLENGQLLSRKYRYKRQEKSADTSKTVLSFKQANGQKWGYITTSVGPASVVNAFAIEKASGELSYALVIKRLNICLVSHAEGVPRWRNAQWFFPGKLNDLECTSTAKKNIFKKASGFPAVLSPYYEEKDTVLVFNSPQAMKRVVFSLKQQFPQLTIPVISQS